jgi:hypothetical protein
MTDEELKNKEEIEFRLRSNLEQYIDSPKTRYYMWHHFFKDLTNYIDFRIELALKEEKEKNK